MIINLFYFLRKRIWGEVEETKQKKEAADLKLNLSDILNLAIWLNEFVFHKAPSLRRWIEI